ncbi:MAG: phytanoyl-CoA dioxygenase family protein [Alphaproteobacteria bacterium]
MPTTGLVTQQQIREYDADGITCVRGVFGAAEVETFRREIERTLNDDKLTVIDYGSEKRFINSFYLWTRNAAIKDLLFDSVLPKLAAEIMGSRKVNILYDQLLIKEPSTANFPTPWHNDQPYWVVSGRQVISFWIALDPVTRESGAVEFIKGSHKWDRWFQPVTFSGANKYEIDPKYEKMPDIDAARDKYDIVHYDLQPGDATVHHGMTVHGAPGNSTNATRRRGYSIRYVGDDVVYRPYKAFPVPYPHTLQAGQPIDSDSFPVVYRA